ncbi:unnamed protein product [Mucor hiemalis]
MCDLNWCPVCDQAISCESDSLYCSLGCLEHDLNHNTNHDFHNFLAPKPCSASAFVTKRFSSQIEASLPTLSSSSSTYTNSTYSTTSSSSSIFTRRADLISRGLLQRNKEKDDDEFPSCCDYCENLNNNLPPVTMKSHNIPFLAEPIVLTIK